MGECTSFDFYSQQRSRASKYTRGRLIKAITLGRYKSINQAQLSGWESEEQMKLELKNMAEIKVEELVCRPSVNSKLLNKKRLSLFVRKSIQSVNDDGSLDEISTNIITDAAAIDGKEHAIDWKFEVINSTASEEARRSVIYYQTEPAEGSDYGYEGQQAIVSMGAVNLQNGRYFSSANYSPGMYRSPYHEIAFYSLAEQLFGAAESGMQSGDGSVITSFIQQI